MTENNTSKFARKRELAKRYGVGERTIERWMQARLLVFIRVRRVVRFDIAGCDQSLVEYGLLS
jgi:hypothetical protein